jgi:hypothetical protein
MADDEEGLPLKYKVDLEGGNPLPACIKYVESENQLYIQTDNEKDLGSYSIEYCASDGYANPTCEKFTVSIEDPMKSKKSKSATNDNDLAN